MCGGGPFFFCVCFSRGPAASIHAGSEAWFGSVPNRRGQAQRCRKSRAEWGDAAGLARQLAAGSGASLSPWEGRPWRSMPLDRLGWILSTRLPTGFFWQSLPQLPSGAFFSLFWRSVSLCQPTKKGCPVFSRGHWAFGSPQIVTERQPNLAPVVAPVDHPRQRACGRG